jgi:hypothetical protein
MYMLRCCSWTCLFEMLQGDLLEGDESGELVKDVLETGVSMAFGEVLGVVGAEGSVGVVGVLGRLMMEGLLVRAMVVIAKTRRDLRL